MKVSRLLVLFELEQKLLQGLGLSHSDELQQLFCQGSMSPSALIF